MVSAHWSSSHATLARIVLELGGTEASNWMSLLPMENRAWARKEMIEKIKNVVLFENLYWQERMWFTSERKGRRERGREGEMGSRKGGSLCKWGSFAFVLMQLTFFWKTKSTLRWRQNSRRFGKLEVLINCEATSCSLKSNKDPDLPHSGYMLSNMFIYSSASEVPLWHLFLT